MKNVKNWGNTPTIQSNLIPFHSVEQLREIMLNTTSTIPRGMGRSYGDSGLNNTIISTTDFNQIKECDMTTGQIVCESGVTFAAIIKRVLPLGWFLPVTPGTKFVSIGGAISANVHGKNHHVHGSLSNHIIYIDVMQTDGQVIRATKTENSDLFFNTCGGMGLTGIITDVCLQLIPVETAYIRQKTIRAKNLTEIMDYFETYNDWTYSVAWIDCLAKGDNLGRSVLMLGEHAVISELQKKKRRVPLKIKAKRKKSIPFFFPNWALNNWSIRLFNFFYYFFNSEKTSIIDYDTFFYPLDGINNWNKMYGNRGFTQYQCVFPLKTSRDGLTELLSKISARGLGSFLAVLKRFGNETLPGLTFPMEGYTLALDFPMNDATLDLMNELDNIVKKFGGRLYLAKDSRMSASLFQSTYTNFKDFQPFKKYIDSKNHLSSLQSKRLKMHG